MVNGYLYIDGIEGPSTSKTNHIDIISFTWGVRQATTFGKGASGKKAKIGRSSFTDVTIDKVSDKTTPYLIDHCATGNILKEVYLLWDKPVGDKQQDYFRIYLKDALITGVEIGGTGEFPTESVSIAFQALEIDYKPEKDDGSLDAAIAKGYDLSALTTDFAAEKQF